MSRPALVVFGPQSNLPSSQYLTDLRDSLVSEPRLSSFVEAIDELPALWADLVKYEPSLLALKGSEFIHELQLWIKDGKALLTSDVWPNTMTMPFTIIIQVIQYFHYLRSEGSGAHSRLLDEAKLGGVQGFCTGFLTAIAVACARDEKDVALFGGIALRLALCMGAYIDLDGLRNKRMSSVAVRWKTSDGYEKLLNIARGFPDAYLSVFRDSTDANITVSKSDVDTVIEQLCKEGFLAKETGLEGRCHSTKNTESLQRLTGFIASRHSFNYPPCDHLAVPVRSNNTGKIVVKDPLHEQAMKCVLIDTADWFMVSSLATESLERGSTILYFGMIDSIPPTIQQKADLKIIKATGMQLGRLPESPPTMPTIKHPNSDINTTSASERYQYPDHAIAVVGMACKFPGANSVNEFWELLTSGTSMLRQMPSERFQSQGLSRSQSRNPVPFWGNFVDDVDAFDHRFFKISSREAASMDPQQRILLQVAYETMASSGYFGTESDDNIGCYLGVCSSDYNDNIASHPPNAYSSLGSLRAFLSGKVSHWFGWTGPSITLDTACSSSAVAIHSACRAIIHGECSQALAGGVSIYTSPYFYQNLSAASFLSPTGATKPFDSQADGYCRGEGAGLVLLKKLSVALADNEKVLGVITGSAINQNLNSTSITVPFGPSQVALYKEVCDSSGIDPGAVSYVEAHGTGTPVGDPIEFESIRRVFGGPHRTSTLRVASVKGNIGHLEGASGVAALIKTLLMIQHGIIPVQANFKVLNTKIGALELDKIEIPTGNQRWDVSFKAACINNYGAAGSNAALIVCEAPSEPNSDLGGLNQHHISDSMRKYPILLSANSSDSLIGYCELLRQQFSDLSSPKIDDRMLASIAFSLASTQNQSLPHKLSSSISTLAELTQLLSTGASALNLYETPKPKPVVLCFGGQVNSFVALDRGVYNGVAILRYYLDRCDSIVRSRGYHSLYPKIFERETVEDIVQLHNMLFSLQYSCAKAWIDSGLVVDTVVGHSFGQLTALVISGILSFEDGLKLVAGRASLMKQCWGSERGTMISVQADINTIKGLLPNTEDNQYEIACYNGTNSHVLVGTKASMDAIQIALTNAASTNHIKWKTLNVTHGFHSVFTEPLLPRLMELAESLSFNNPKIPIETCSKEVSWKRPGPQSIVEHTRTPVYFGEAVNRIVERLGHCTWIEAGSNSSITNMVSQALPKADTLAHSFQPLKIDTSSSIDFLAGSTVQLWKHGHKIQFWPFHRMQKSDFSLISLPPYQFEKSRHWLPWKENINVAAPSVSGTSNSCEMLVFVKNNSDYGADYIVNFRSDEFQLIVGGHEVLGSPLCPAPLYIELAARAAALLNQGPGSSKHTWSVEELEIKTPLGLSTNGELRLSLERAMSTSNCYTFVIRSYVSTGENKDNTTSLTHAIGKLNQQSDSTRFLADFDRYSRLIGYQRITSLRESDDVEAVQGSMVYKVFSKVVKYAKYYEGVKFVCAKEREVAGKISIPINNEICLQNTTTRPLAIDNFIQVAGIHVNNLSFSEDANVFVCTKVDQILPSRIYHESGIDSQSWEVYSTYSFNGDREVVNDIFVFNPSNKGLVMIILGAVFTKVLASSLAKALSKINGSTVSNAGSHFQPMMVPSDDNPSPSKQTTLADASISYPLVKDPVTQSIGFALCQLLSKVTDIPVNAIKEDATLEELGIDSLMITEVHTEVCNFFKIDIPGLDFQGLENIKAIKEYLLANGRSDESAEATPSHTSGVFEESDTSPFIVTPMSEIPNRQNFSKFEFMDRKPASLAHAQRAFEEIRHDYNTFTDQTGFTDFFKLVYPTQTRLVLAYIVEAFATLGCDLSETKPGEELTMFFSLPKHELLMAQLIRVLKDSSLVVEKDGKLVRTDNSVDEVMSGAIFTEIMEKFPQHSSEHQLLRVTGSRLSDCLVGKADPLRLLFSDKENKRLLEEVYANGPMYKAITMLLGGFLAKAYATANMDEVFHILEIGGGTGGTTKYIIDFLTSLGRPFTYTFTDISASLVSEAKRRFSDYSFMDFQALDVEKPGPSHFNGRYHTIISTNAVHATRDLTHSLKNIKQMLREDGFVSLVEFTRNLYWFDLVFGLLEGWWRFEDGREHVLANEWLWDNKMRDAGFKHVSWTDGISEEARTLRVITGFVKEAESDAFKPKLAPLKAEALIETVLIKQIGNCSLYADVYLPSTTEIQSKLPIALLIHGGGHVMFTRRNINIPQTKILLGKGFLPVAIDYRFCPELTLLEGPMADCCEAFRWARFELPKLRFKNAPGLLIDGERIAVVGWSTGGHLAMSVGFTSIQRGLRPPEAILAFYPPTDYEDECWTKPIFPAASLSQPNEEYDLLEGVRDEPISTYFPASNKNFPGGMMTLHDPRWRFVLHMNWKAQMVPVLLHGLPSRSTLAGTSTNPEMYSDLPQPLKEDILPISPLAQILRGNYQSPTFFVHGTSDDLIPLAQSERAYEALMVRGIKAGIFKLEGADHLFDFFQDRSVGRRGPVAVEAGYRFLVETV